MSESRDISKLPKWAQQRIQIAERDLAAAKQRLAAGPEDSNVFADPHMDNKALGKDTTVRFNVSDDEHLDVRFDGKRLEVYCLGSMLVHPRSSNVVHIGATDRHNLGGIL